MKKEKFYLVVAAVAVLVAGALFGSGLIGCGKKKPEPARAARPPAAPYCAPGGGAAAFDPFDTANVEFAVIGQLRKDVKTEVSAYQPETGDIRVSVRVVPAGTWLMEERGKE